MRLRRMQHSGTHCVAFFGTRGRQGIRHPRSNIYDPSPLIGEMWEEPDTDPPRVQYLITPLNQWTCSLSLIVTWSIIFIWFRYTKVNAS
jgi:hypothetical protein